jgi:alkanesulfonate monooxygenase SsuD/methylene tetrahydromethanopterin reductase-like flavin-dependent oxidoreductase (luciferase family)
MAPQYAAIAGFPEDLAQRIREAYSGGHFHEATAAAAVVPDELIPRFSLVGTPEDVRGQLRDLRQLGIRHVEFLEIGENRLAAAELFADEVIAHLQ